MKIFKEKFLKASNGITLIALVITIIVLLILAGISISMLSGDNGILQKATDAKTNTERQSIIEQARIDVLGYQAENKGGDLDKTQLKSVLDTYFKSVPDLSDMSDAEIKEKQLETLPKYGIHTITVSEIYNGNITGSSNAKAVAMFEDKAGDEDGATEGKIHIGDYINYNPIAQGDTGTESKYKYSSLNDYTGVTEALSANKITGFTDSSQDFTAKSNLKWQVFGIDGENLLITTENPIIPDNPISTQIMPDPYTTQTITGYYLYGAKAYINISPTSGKRNEINNISQIYKYGKGSDISKARGMTIEDVNNITGVTADETTINPSGIYRNSYGDAMYEYGAMLSEYKKGSDSGWTPESWLDSNIDKSNNANAPGISGRITYYNYWSSNTNLKTSDSIIRYKLIFGENNNVKRYWLSTRSFAATPQSVFFGVGNVNNGKVESSCSGFCSTRPAISR